MFKKIELKKKHSPFLLYFINHSKSISLNKERWNNNILNVFPFSSANVIFFLTKNFRYCINNKKFSNENICFPDMSLLYYCCSELYTILFFSIPVQVLGCIIISMWEIWKWLLLLWINYPQDSKIFSSKGAATLKMKRKIENFANEIY